MWLLKNSQLTTSVELKCSEKVVVGTKICVLYFSLDNSSEAELSYGRSRYESLGELLDSTDGAHGIDEN